MLRYLVLEVGLRGQVSSRTLGDTLRLSDTEVDDALDELEELGLVRALRAMRSAVTSKAAAWLYWDSP